MTPAGSPAHNSSLDEIPEGRVLACDVARHRRRSPFLEQRELRHQIMQSQLRAKAAEAKPPPLPIDVKQAITRDCADHGWSRWEVEELVGELPEVVADWYADRTQP